VSNVEMPVTGSAASGAAMRKIMDHVRTAHAARIWPEIGNPTAAQHADMPHVIDCPHLTVHDLEEAFTEAFQGRRLWCRQNCRGVFAVEPIWDDVEKRDTGRRFRFSDQEEAAMFRLTWC
jgi:hypothetical protein